MSSGVASASASAYNPVPPSVGGAPAAYASYPAALGAGATTQPQNGPPGYNADSIAANTPLSQNPLIRAEMVAPVPPSNVAASDSAQIFKIGNSGLVAITVAGVLIGLTSFVGIQAVYEARGNRHKHEYLREQKHQEDLNNAAKSGTARHDVSDANFEKSAAAHQKAIVAALSPLTESKREQLKKALNGAPEETEKNALTNLRREIAAKLAEFDRAEPHRAPHIAKHAALLHDVGTHAAHDRTIAKLSADYAAEHKAFVSKALDPIAHAFIAARA